MTPARKFFISAIVLGAKIGFFVCLALVLVCSPAFAYSPKPCHISMQAQKREEPEYAAFSTKEAAEFFAAASKGKLLPKTDKRFWVVEYRPLMVETDFERDCR
ncbi:MAG TPA: hypothetical protein V6D12_14010 [Candidatus Obscuribacterales bacterium]